MSYYCWDPLSFYSSHAQLFPTRTKKSFGLLVYLPIQYYNPPINSDMIGIFYQVLYKSKCLYPDYNHTYIYISSCYITIISYNSITISFYIDHVSSLFRMSMLIIGILPYHFFNNNPFSGHSAFKTRDNICTTVLKYINTWFLKSK